MATILRDSPQCRRILASEVASEHIFIKREPSWIQNRKRLGERLKCQYGGAEFTMANSKTQNACTAG